MKSGVTKKSSGPKSLCRIIVDPFLLVFKGASDLNLCLFCSRGLEMDKVKKTNIIRERNTAGVCVIM